MSAPLLQVEGLRKSFGSFLAVRDVTFDVPAGGMIGTPDPTGRGARLGKRQENSTMAFKIAVAGATGNVVFKNATNKIKADVSTGMQLNFSMRTTGIFPAMAVQMTAIGEESGALDEMLDKVASFYETEVDNMVDGLTALMEPMIMAVLGVLVGGLVIAMYLPIFQLGAVV